MTDTEDQDHEPGLITRAGNKSEKKTDAEPISDTRAGIRDGKDTDAARAGRSTIGPHSDYRTTGGTDEYSAEAPETLPPPGAQTAADLAGYGPASSHERTFEPAPEDLGEAGRERWDAMVRRYLFGPHEVPVLAEYCRTVDDLAEYRADVREHGRMSTWGDGRRVNPAAVEMRQARLTLARLLGSLGILADVPEGSERTRYRRHRADKYGHRAMS